MLEKTQTHFFFGLMAIIAVAAFVMALPYLPAVIFAGALAVVFQPIFDRLLNLFKGRRSLATWGTLFLVALIVFLPLFFLGYQVVNESKGLYSKISVHGLDGFPIGQQVQDVLDRFAPSLATNSKDVAQKGLGWMISSAEFVLTNLITVIFNIFICFIALFYLLKDGNRLKEWVILFSPLPDKYDNMILERLTATVTSVIRGTLVIATIQGALAGIGFMLFGIPNPALWGSAAAIAALIPGVGTAIVLIPAVIYAFVFIGIPQGIALAAWSFFAIGLIDNILGPRLMRRGARIHPFVIFIAVLGGLAYFGPLGFVIGPLVFSLLLTLLDIYASFKKTEPHA
jgi:predicted PurR-regulated permease PerM